MDIGQMAMLNWSTMHLLQIILSKSWCEGFLSWKIGRRLTLIHESSISQRPPIFRFSFIFLAILFSMSAQVRWSSYALTHAIFGYHWRSVVRKPMQNENENQNSQQRTEIKLKSHASPSFMVALATSLLIFSMYLRLRWIQDLGVPVRLNASIYILLRRSCRSIFKWWANSFASHAIPSPPHWNCRALMNLTVNEPNRIRQWRVPFSYNQFNDVISNGSVQSKVNKFISVRVVSCLNRRRTAILLHRQWCDFTILR